MMSGANNRNWKELGAGTESLMMVFVEHSPCPHHQGQ